MFLFSIFFLFILGTIIGSFLNVLVIRGNTGRSVGGRSGCMSCGAQLKARDLVPIASYIFLRGRCRYCGSAISIQYPIVEFLGGVVVVLAYMHAVTYAAFLLLASVCIVLLYITVYDVRHTIITDASIGALFALSIISALFLENGDWVMRHLLSAIICTVPFLILWYGSSGRAMGFGDVKLACVLGLFLVPMQAAAFLWVAFVSGGAVSLLLLGMQKLLVHIPSLRRYIPVVTMKSEIPFGPFLIAGFLLVVFCGIDMLTVLEWFTV